MAKVTIRKSTPNYYRIMAIGAAIGVVAAFWQTLDKITLLKNTNALLPCNLNSVFNCNNVLNAWQSSVFGFPNSIMCLVLFVTFFVTALVGLTGGTISKKMRLGVQFLSLFTLGFALWFLQQSTYAIGSICIFCLFCFVGLLAVNATWHRINLSDYPFSGQTKQKLANFNVGNKDIMIWIAIAAIVAMAIVFRFYT